MGEDQTVHYEELFKTDITERHKPARKIRMLFKEVIKYIMCAL